MEREPSFERHEALNEYYRQLIEVASFEIARNPETRAELRNFVQYISLIQQAAPLITWLPYQQREQAVHWEIEREVFPQLPLTLPPPHKRVAVGEHMDITIGVSADTCWPDDSRRLLKLPDGTTVIPDMPVGRIDIVRGFDRLSEDTNMIGFMRKLMESSVASLKDLATLCKRNDPRLEGIEVFAGVSHLARIAGKFGFTTFEISDPHRRAQATDVSKTVAEHVSGGARAWNEVKQNYKPAQVAFISITALVEKFGA